MTIGEALDWGGRELTEAGIEEGAEEAKILLSELTGIGKLDFFLKREEDLPADVEKQYRAFLGKRKKRIPLQMILGYTEFMGLEFEVSPATLVPRADTEVVCEKALSFLTEGMRILDLGTGSGYLSFPIAKNNPGCDVIGLDIVKAALEANRTRADVEEIKNLSFVSYDGIDFPFEDDTFDLVVTRYALHHFPDIEHSVGEVSRVLKNGGKFFISDPCPNECDSKRFVDDYMRLKKDGHIKFYTKEEWNAICSRQGLVTVDSFDSSIRFPKKKDTALGYEEVLEKHDKAVIESYDLVETDTELYITERVNNILFKKILLSV